MSRNDPAPDQNREISAEKSDTNFKLVNFLKVFLLLISFGFLKTLRLNRKDPIHPPKMDCRITRYVCLTCPNSCELYVRGEIRHFRNVCPQFQDNDGRPIWVKQWTRVAEE